MGRNKVRVGNEICSRVPRLRCAGDAAASESSWERSTARVSTFRECNLLNLLARFHVSLVNEVLSLRS